MLNYIVEDHVIKIPQCNSKLNQKEEALDILVLDYTSNSCRAVPATMFVPEVRRFAPTVSIVGDDYCYPYLVELSVNKTVGLSSKHVSVMDPNGDLLLQVAGAFWQFNKKRTMHNSFGVPIITMRGKALPWHQEWTVHRGERPEESNLLYTVQRPHSFRLKTKLEIFLSTNSNREFCDFRVIGSYTSQSFKVYKGQTLLAEVKEKFKLGSLGKENFQARIYPGIDYAFVLSLLVIFCEIDL